MLKNRMMLVCMLAQVAIMVTGCAVLREPHYGHVEYNDFINTVRANNIQLDWAASQPMYIKDPRVEAENGYLLCSNGKRAVVSYYFPNLNVIFSSTVCGEEKAKEMMVEARKNLNER